MGLRAVALDDVALQSVGHAVPPVGEGQPSVADVLHLGRVVPGAAARQVQRQPLDGEAGPPPHAGRLVGLRLGSVEPHVAHLEDEVDRAAVGGIRRHPVVQVDPQADAEGEPDERHALPDALGHGEGMDDVGVIHKITNLISGELKINISALSVEAREGLFQGNIKVFVHDKEELEELVQRLKDLPGIESVERYDTEDIA